jgi:hypothetical protein
MIDFMPETPTLVAENSRPRRRSSIALYSVAFLIVQVVLLLAALWISTKHWFLVHCYNGMLQSGYSLRLNHADCDVVIYGDSSSMTGLDPEIIQQITGLKTCNIAEGSTITDVIGTRYPLDQYLLHNKRPRFLLMMYTSSMFRPDVKLFNAYRIEGMTYAFQYEHTPEFLGKLVRHHPFWPIRWASFVGQEVVNYFVQRYVYDNHHFYTDTRAQREGRHGVWPIDLPPETHCVRRPVSKEEVGRHADEVESIRRHLSVGGTKVFINISPVPDCDVSYAVYSDLAQGLHDNVFEKLPISYFNQGDVHYSPQGSRYISIEAGDEILAVERQQDAARRSASGVAP